MARITNTRNEIHKYEVVERLEILRGRLKAAQEAEGNTEEFAAWVEVGARSRIPGLRDVLAEYLSLRSFMDNIEAIAGFYPLVREGHFQAYIRQTIIDRCELPPEFESGFWPWKHIRGDWRAAADEARDNYEAALFDGVVYLMRVK